MNSRHNSPLKTVGSIIFLVLALALALLLASTPALAEAPLNDSFAGATEIYSLPFSDYLYTGDATPDPADPVCGGTNATVWYRYTPDHDMTFAVTTWGGYTPSDYETSLSVYSWDGMTLNQVACVEPTWAQPLVFEATGWTTYYVMVSAWGPGGNLYISVDEVVPPPPPPENDAIESPMWIGGLPFAVDQDTSSATTAYDDPSCSGNGATVWFAFTPTSNIRIEADTIGSYYDTTLSVYTDVMGYLEQLACNDDWYGVQSYVSLDLNAGQTYYFMVAAYGGGSGGYLSFHVNEAYVPPPPANDDFVNANVIEWLDYYDYQNTRGATVADDDPWTCYQPYSTVWYRFTPDRNMRLLVDIYNSNYMPTITILTGEPGMFDSVVCGYPEVTFDAQAGVTYTFLIGDTAWGGPSLPTGGDLGFHVRELPPPLSLELTIDPQGTFSSITGAATVYGTVTCSRPVSVQLEGQVSQFVGRLNTLRGYYSTSFACDGSTAWSASASPENGRFAGGHAQVTANAWACDWNTGECASADAGRSVTLSRAPK